MTAARKIDPIEVERRRQAILAHDRERKRDAAAALTPNQKRRRTALENAARKREILARGEPQYGGYTSGWNLKPVVVLVPWHVDETGCRARVVGCD